jgi:hypothetical protein
MYGQAGNINGQYYNENVYNPSSNNLENNGNPYLHNQNNYPKK